jgi:hypothetical protein
MTDPDSGESISTRGGAPEADRWPAAVQPLRSPRRKTLGVILAVAAVVLVLGGSVGGRLWWRSGVASPSHSLVQLATAAQHRNWSGVQKYADLDALIGQYMTVAAAKAAGPDSAGMGLMLATMMADSKSGMVREFKDRLRASVESTSNASKSKGKVAAGAFGTKSIKSEIVSGDRAFVVVEASDPTGAKYDVELKMRRVGDHWRVVAIENLESIPFIKNMKPR